MTTGIQIREAARADLPRLHAINQASTPGVGAVAPAELAGLVARSWRTLVAAEAERPLGFLLCLRPGADYQSPNYRWFSARRPGADAEFLYVDRIAVAGEARGRRLGEALYHAVIAAAPGWVVCCEVNLQPPNPGSMRFHSRLGFQEVGRAVYEPGLKEVAFLERPSSPAS